MSHVTEQIADAIVATLVAKIPAFGGRVSKYGVPPSGRRAYPTAVVMSGDVQVSTQLSGNRRSGRAQTRTMSLAVAIRDLETAGGDYSARLTDLAAAVEGALAGWDDLPIDDIRLDSDSGVQDIDEDDETGVHAGIALIFEVNFITVEGNATSLALPNN